MWNVPTLQRAARLISEAMPHAISIDNFINAHRDSPFVECCAKLAIVWAILQAENRCCLNSTTGQSGRDIDFWSLEGSWLNQFMQLLTEECDRAALPGRLAAVSLVIFNYDRCVEQFICHWLSIYYGISTADAAELVMQIAIFHPYGQVGFLPWRRAEISVPFGEEPDSETLFKLTSQIKTFTEGTDPNSSDIENLRANLIEAERVVFLGFAFHPLNMGLLWGLHPSGGPGAPTSCYGTAYKVSQNDVRIIEADLKRRGRILHGQVFLDDVPCNELFSRYRLSLSFQ